MGFANIFVNTNTPSKRYQLNNTDLAKIGKGAGIAVGGALLTYLASIIGDIDFGAHTPTIVAVLSILINALLKFLEDNR